MKSLTYLLKTFSPADWIILIYNFSILSFLFFPQNKTAEFGYFISIHLLIIIWVLSLTWNNNLQKTKLNQWLKLWYPLFTLIWFIPELSLLQKLYVAKNFNPELLLVETTLFPQRYYFTMPLTFSPILLEIFHGVIISFFFLLLIPAWLKRRINDKIVKEYVFIITFSTICHFWMALLIPVHGPADLRLELFPEGFFFIPIANFLTGSFFQSGATISSLLVTLGVIITAYVSKLFPKIHRLMILWLFLLLISTVICTFHYSVSAMGGMLTGLLFLSGGKKLYEKTY